MMVASSKKRKSIAIRDEKLKQLKIFNEGASESILTQLPLKELIAMAVKADESLAAHIRQVFK